MCEFLRHSAIMFGVIGTLVLVFLFMRSVAIKSFKAFLLYSGAFVAIVNMRFFFMSTGEALTLFVGIIDLLDNTGVSTMTGIDSNSTCSGNNCAALNGYVYHASWAMSLFERYVNATPSRTTALLVHIGCQTMAFVLSIASLKMDGLGCYRAYHSAVGYLSVLFVSLGLLAACDLASDHDKFTSYGGIYSRYGFWLMAVETFVPVFLGIKYRQLGDVDAHRRWMLRYLGSLFGSFVIFRCVILLSGPLLRSYDGAAHLLAVWTSCPIGMALAEACVILTDRAIKE